MQFSSRRAVHAALALLAALICWFDVSWALRPGLFPILDEIGTRAIVEFPSYWQILHLLPTQYYADRPLGWAFLKLMGNWFDFDYAKQAACLIAIHFANCVLAFRLFRKLSVSAPLAIAGVALFGGLWTTAQTATYLGEAFDPICLFFVLASILAALSDRMILSALLFLAALRSKEFAIMTPFLLALLLALRLPTKGLTLNLARRLWPHFLILALFATRYAYLYREYLADLAPDNLYRMDFHPATVLKSLSYYTSLVFGADDLRPIPPVLLATIFVVLLAWSILRRRAGIAFGLSAYVLFALPVLLMPRTRSAYWIYAPQVFLILALCLLAQELLARLPVREPVRWTAAVCLALACMIWLAEFRRSGYFRDRLHWTLDVRRISARTAREANAKIPKLPAGGRVYVNHAPDATPWLFAAGPCSYLQIVNRQQKISCTLDHPERFYADPGPKTLVDYRADGSISVSR